jgi:hypothetical protein
MSRARGESGWSAAGSIGQLLRCCVILRDATWNEDGTYTLRCVYCSRVLARDEVTIDHLIPRAHGGTNERDNLATACPECNGNDPDKHVPRRVFKQAEKPITALIRERARVFACGWYPGLAEKWAKNREAQRKRDAARRERAHRKHVRTLRTTRERSRKERAAYGKARSEGRRAIGR